MNSKTDYSAKKISSSIIIDGNVKKEVWQNAQWSKRFVDMVTNDPGMYNTQTAILWNDSHLYVAFVAEEPFVEAFQKERDSIVFLENDLEVFIEGGKEVQPHPAMALNSHGIYDTHLPEKWSKIKFGI